MPEHRLVVGRLCSTRHHEELARAGNGVRDSVERHTVEEAVDQPVRVVAVHQVYDRLRLGEEIADRCSSVLRLRSANSDGHPTGSYRIVARDDHGMIAVERLSEGLTRGFPVERSPRLGAG